MAEQVEVVVLGAGVAGYVCAIRLAQLGKKVTVIDKAELGGVCLNRGCIPSKALIAAGSFYEKLSHASEMGITVKGAELDLPTLMKWKDSVVQKLTGGVGGLLKANGCTVIQGEAKFIGPKTLEVKAGGKTQQLQFQSCVIATGSRPSAPPIPGLEIDQKLIIDSTGALQLQKVPKSLLCIGGGYIGLELGTFYSKVGSKVTVVEATPNLLNGVDPDLTRVVQRKLERNKVTLMLGTQVKSLKKNKNSVEVTLLPVPAPGQPSAKEVKLEFDAVLVTVGRTPNSENLGLDKLGLKPDSKGFLTVDAQRKTSAPGIYAIGDIAGQPLLAHKGSKEGMVAAEAIAGMKTAYDVVAMPAVIFTDPEIATVGLSEAECKAQNLKVQIGNFPFVANGRALSIGEPDGFVKIIEDAQTGRLLGVHIVGAEASNLISEGALALEMGAHVEDLALTVHPHPTLSETLMEASEAALGHAVHIFQKKSPQPPSRDARL